jgi:hypothetical protein
MRDRDGKRIRDGAPVVYQYGDAGAHFGRVVDASSHRARELRAVLVDFEQGNRPQFIGGEYLRILEDR